jgi:hypothetical protein
VDRIAGVQRPTVAERYGGNAMQWNQFKTDAIPAISTELTTI